MWGYTIRWIQIVLSIILVASGSAIEAQEKHRVDIAPEVSINPQLVGRTDDALARKEAELRKYGGEASYEYLRFKQNVAVRETLRWSWTFPDSSAMAPIAAPLTPTLMTWAPLGPTVLYGTAPSRVDLNSGRPTAIVTHPTTPSILYMAVAGGGVWKCTNASLASSGDWTWNNITDALPASSALGNISVGDLAMDPVHPETLYLGMGDPLSVKAIGFFITHDGGATWTRGGELGNATAVRMILPIGANTLLVLTNEAHNCIYRSTDGGISFTNIALPTTFYTPYFTCFSAAAFTQNNLVMTGSTVDLITGDHVPTWITSSDGGLTWAEALVPSTFMPSGATNPHTLYADGAPKVVAGSGGKGYALVGDGTTRNIAKGLYVTSDYGATWAFQDSPTFLTMTWAEDGGQPGYNMMLTVDPADSRKVFAGAQYASFRSLDSGITWEQLTTNGGWQRVYAHADFHVATWSKTGPKTLYMGNDGGIAILRDPYRTAIPSGTGTVASDTTFLDHTRNKGIQSQLVYTIASTTASTPVDSIDRVALGMQDNSTGIRSNAGGAMAASGSYESFPTGDGMGVLFHPLDGTKLIAAGFANQITLLTNVSSSGSFLETHSIALSGQNTFYTPIVPIRSDPTGNSVLSAAWDILYKSTDFGITWTPFPMAGIAPNFGIYRIAASPTNPQVFAVSGEPNHGYYTSNSGATWSPFGTLPSNGSFPYGYQIWGISIGASDQTLYATSTWFNQFTSHIWKSLDRGTTWLAIDGSPTASNGFPFGLPVQFLRESLVAPSTLYAGTDFGLYASKNSGATWSRFGAGLPMVQVTDMYEAPDGSFLRVATYGRGAWEIRLTTPAPVINRFVPAASALTNGQSTTLSWDVVGATSLSLTPGNLDVTPLTSTAISPAATTTYTLTATNSAGSATAQTTVTVVPAPTASLSAAQTTISSGTSTTLTPTFTGGTASIAGLSGPFTSGTPVSTGDLTTTTSFILTVTNVVGTKATSSVTITVATGPTASLSAAQTTITSGTSTMLTPTFSGGTATISGLTGPFTSGAPVSTGNLTATTTFTLMVTDSSRSASADVTITVVDVPTASLTSTQTTITPGTSTTLTPIFTGGTASIAGLTGPFISGTPVGTGSLAATTTFTLIVTNAAGSAAFSSITITVAEISLAVSPIRTHMGTGVPLEFTATVKNATNPNVTWTVSGGSLSATSGSTVTFTAPTTPGVVTLTITSLQDTSRTKSLVIEATSLDLRPDGSVDVLDMAILAQAFTGAGNKGAANYLSSADLDGDGDVDEDDVALFLLQL